MFAWSWKENSPSTGIVLLWFSNIFTNAPIVKLHSQFVSVNQKNPALIVEARKCSFLETVDDCCQAQGPLTWPGEHLTTPG